MQYPLGTLAKTCAGSGQPLAPGAECVTALVLSGGEIRRQDFLHSAWDLPPEGTIAHWPSRVPEQTGPRIVGPEELFAQFEQLDDEAVPATERTRYVLALSLLKAKRLELVSATESQKDGGGDEAEHFRVLTLLGSRSEGPFEVRDFELPEEEIAAIHAAFAGGATETTEGDAT